jgi:hypothetical protein
MNKNLLYIFALPLGLLLSSILPMIYGIILEHFIPFESLSNILKSYMIPVSSGSILTAAIVLIVPDYKKIFGYASVVLTIVIIFVFLEWTLFYGFYLLGQIFGLLFLIKERYSEIDNIEKGNFKDIIKTKQFQYTEYEKDKGYIQEKSDLDVLAEIPDDVVESPQVENNDTLKDPIGELTDDEFIDAILNDYVTDGRLADIATKLSINEKLSNREQKIARKYKDSLNDDYEVNTGR